jgi:hypothetical protein
MDRKLVAIILGALVAVFFHLMVDAFNQYGTSVTVLNQIAMAVGGMMVLVSLWVLFTVIFYGIFSLAAAIWRLIRV